MGKGRYIFLRLTVFSLVIISMVATSAIMTVSNVDAATKLEKKRINKVVQTAKKKKGKSIRSFPSYFNSGRWCADFVYWTSKKAKLNNNKVFPKTKRGVSGYISWYKKKGLYRKNTKKFKPRKGDLVFLSSSSHVGIVAKVTRKYVYIIHGNWSNRVKYTKLKMHGYTSSQRAKIKGYARVNY